MIYYVSEVQYDDGVQRTAGTKARSDVENILSSLGYKMILIENKTTKSELRLKSLSLHTIYYNEWKKVLGKLDLKKDDELIVQFPVIYHSLFLAALFRSLKKKGVKITVLIHDLDMIRMTARDDVSAMKKVRVNLEEKQILKIATKIIVHNKFMLKKLTEMGVDKGKMKTLEIFDYLLGEEVSDFKNSTAQKNDPIIIAGALRKHKVGYIYSLPLDVKFNLYGVGYEDEGKGNINYFGSFPADSLPFELFGSFGLVWDGESSDTCSGAFGEYLRVNNPHKTSLYLSSGIPVIIWENAALAEFVKHNNCGITVKSLHEIKQKLDGLTEQQYAEIKENALKIGKQLREGYYTRKAVK